jgi:regulator of sigma E protease
MQDGDRLLAVDGVQIITFEDLIRELHKDGVPAEREILVERKGSQLPLKVRPEGGRIQVGYARELRVMPVTRALPAAVHVTWDLTLASLSAIGQLFHRGGAASLSGPIGIVQQAVVAMKRGIAEFIALLAQISVGLAIFNMLPVPALDGGRIVFLSYEIVLRRRPNMRFEQILSFVGVLALISLVVGVTVFGDLQLGNKLFGK